MKPNASRQVRRLKSKPASAPPQLNEMRTGAWLASARQALSSRSGGAGAGGETAGLEAQALLAHVLQKPRAWLLAHPEFPLNAAQLAQLDGLLERLVSGEPLPYLLGHWEFYGLNFLVTPDVLIPRPETELLVERALGWLQRHPDRRRAADVGSGSGCIAVTLAKTTPHLRVLLVDRSWAALQVARRNAAAHAVTMRSYFALGNLLSAFSGPLDLVCANLPYIPRGALGELPVARHEPWLALDGGADGLALIRALLADSPRWLAPGGLMLLEIQYDQGDEVAREALRCLPGADVAVHQDLAGLPRLVEIHRPES